MIQQDPPDHSDLAKQLAKLTRPGILLRHRVITEGDENALLPGEAEAFASSVLRVRRQSGAARRIARELLSEFGLSSPLLPRSTSRAPVWPPGIVGSLAHDSHVAIAAVASDKAFAGIGIDVEPADPLPRGLADKVATPTERRTYGERLTESRLLFTIKEAVYKACHPIDGIFLDFQDVEVDLMVKQAVTRSGRCVAVDYFQSPRVVALAYITVVAD